MLVYKINELLMTFVIHDRGSYHIKRNEKCFSSVYVLRNKVCLCDGSVNCRSRSFFLKFSK